MTVGSKLDSIIESQTEMQTAQAVMANDMKHLIADNVEFKENLTTLKTDYYKTKGIVEKHGIWFTIIHFITVSLLGFLGFKSM